MNHTTEATVDSKYQGYRVLTLLVPLNAPTTTVGMKKNMKLHHIMRMFVYTLRQRTGYHRIAPQADTRLRYGALCVQWKRQMKSEHVLESAEVQSVLERLQSEAICPFAQLFDDDGTGDAPPLHSLHFNGHATKSKPLQLSAATLRKGVCMDRAHVPTFARQILTVAANGPYHKLSLADYETLFGDT